jgi:CheY-like chemotaxis protein
MLANLRKDRARCKSVLLVEDDPMVRGIVHDMLVGDNYQVIAAADGHDALNVWEQRQNEIEILITDVQMPGMSGITLAQQLTTQQTSLKALYISGYPESIAEANLIKIPLLQKPFGLDALSTALRSLLNQPLRNWKCPSCGGKSYHALAAYNVETNVTLAYTCGACEIEYSTCVQALHPLRECPFCLGRILLGGHGFVGSEGYHLGHICYDCRAVVKLYTPNCATIPW